VVDKAEGALPVPLVRLPSEPETQFPPTPNP
jgi:hypothetical protein